jgi:hypothetical protein
LRADPRFLGQDTAFWAHVRTISQEVGYTDRKTKNIRVPTFLEVQENFERLQLSTLHIANKNGSLSKFGSTLDAYFNFRASVLNDFVQKNLMGRESAETEFKKLHAKLNPKCPLPMNKQKGEKRNFAFLTGIVNMLVEANIGRISCDYDPRSLTTITHDSMPLMTLARRVDGAFPKVVNPIAIWEIKEYYYTTTFGSRVADGVYETLLDGLELADLATSAGRKVHHLLVIDDHFTWWQCGRSYLCRIIDMLHMGLVDEVIFGREVLTRLPVLLREWRAEYEAVTVQKSAKNLISNRQSQS